MDYDTITSPTAIPSGKLTPIDVIDSGMVSRWIPVGSALRGEVDTGSGELSNRLVDIAAGTATIVETLGGGVYHAAGEEIGFHLDIGDVDTERVAYVRVVFTHTQASADTPIFKVKFSTSWLDNVGALTSVTGAAITTTFTTLTLTAHTNAATANAWEFTLPSATSGYIAAKSLPQAPFIILGVELDNLGGASADEIALRGVILYYYRKN